MKKTIIYIFAIVFILSSISLLAGCDNRVEIVAFKEGHWDYSDKVTFNMGSDHTDGTLEEYLKQNSRKVKMREKAAAWIEKIYSVKIELDTDILNKSFDDADLTAFVKKTKELLDVSPQAEKADVFVRAAIRHLGLSGIVLCDSEEGILYKNYCKSMTEGTYFDIWEEWQLFLEKSESALVKRVSFDWSTSADDNSVQPEQPYLKKSIEKIVNQNLRKGNAQDAAESISWRYEWRNAPFNNSIDFYLGNNEEQLNLGEYLDYAQRHAETCIIWSWHLDMNYAKHWKESDYIPEEYAFLQKLRELKESGVDDFVVNAMALEYLELEGQFLITTYGNSYFVWHGRTDMYEKVLKIQKHNKSNLIGSIKVI